MLKKILLPLLLLAATQQLLPMEPMIIEVDYEQLFLACEENNLDLVKNIIKNTPNININQQDSEGRTPLLCAAYQGNWKIIHYLLINKANKTIRDNYGQSLFSKMVYCVLTLHSDFYKSLAFYTFDDMTQECKTIPLPQKAIAKRQIKPLNQHVINVLAGINNINNKDRHGNSALLLTCTDGQLPIIIELLKRGANLRRYNDHHSAYRELESSCKRKSPFVIREAFNNGPHKSAALLSYVFSDTSKESLTSNLLPELTNHIKNIYINHCLVSDQERNAEKAIWKPVCVDACKLAGINETDESRCLTQLMLLSQRKKTEINLLLLKEGK